MVHVTLSGVNLIEQTKWSRARAFDEYAQSPLNPYWYRMFWSPRSLSTEGFFCFISRAHGVECATNWRPATSSQTVSSFVSICASVWLPRWPQHRPERLLAVLWS